MHKTAKMVLVGIIVLVSVYAIVRVAIDPNWYFGKSLVPEYVTMDNFWDYVIRSAR